MAATLITLGSWVEYDAGAKKVPALSSLVPLLPAAQTMITPCWLAYWSAFWITSSVPGPPQLALITLAPWSTAYSIADAAAVSVPLPVASRNFTGMSWTFHATPVTPSALLPTAAISPAVNVPWPWSSIGLLVPVIPLLPVAA